MRRQPPSSAAGSQGGIALVLVLWVIALMTIMALAAVSTSRTEINLVRNRMDEARVRALAEAGVSMAVLHLRSASEEDRWYPDGVANRWLFSGEEVEIRIYNESSRIDLNKAPQQLLLDLITAAGVEGVDAAAVAAALLDWRDPDEEERPQGAEDPAYRGDGLPYGAKDGPFDSAGEIGLVAGVHEELSRLLGPHLTVYALNSQVMAEYASPLVRAALAGADPQRAQDKGEEDDPAPGAAAEGGSRSIGGPVYRIRVNGAGLAVETLVRLGSGRAGIVTTLSRRFHWLDEAPETAGGEGRSGRAE